MIVSGEAAGILQTIKMSSSGLTNYRSINFLKPSCIRNCCAAVRSHRMIFVLMDRTYICEAECLTLFFKNAKGWFTVLVSKVRPKQSNIYRVSKKIEL